MARKKSKQSEVQNEYNKSWRNFRARVKAAENKGFVFGDNLPTRVKKPTEASIRKLERLRGRNLWEKAIEAFNPETFERTSPIEAIKARRRQTWRRQSVAQKQASERRRIDEGMARLTLGRPREKGETHRQYIEAANEKEEQERAEDEYYLWLAVQRELEQEQDRTEKAELLSEEQYDAEIENAYASGEYEDARELERERDRYYPPEDENIAETSIDSRFGDAISIIKQYSPEMAERIDNAYNEYLERTGGESLDTSLSGKALEDFTSALSNLEDIKYKGNEMAWWGIYTKIDKALNNKRHGAAEKRAFFGRLQSGDFNYE